MKKRKISIIIALCLMSAVIIMGCGKEDSQENSQEKTESATQEQLETSEQNGEETAKEDEDKKVEEEQEKVKYPSGIDKGYFMATKYELNDNSEKERVQTNYYNEKAQVIRKDFDNGITKVFVSYDQDGNITEEDAYRNGNWLYQKCVREDGKIVRTDYQKSGEVEEYVEYYLDQYKIVDKIVYIDTIGREHEYDMSHDYEYYDNGNPKLAKIRVGQTYFNNDNMYFREMFYIMQNFLDFDENGRMIRSTYCISNNKEVYDTWSYDNNGWVVEETHDKYNNYEKAFKPINYVWEYTQVEPGSNVYEELTTPTEAPVDGE